MPYVRTCLAGWRNLSQPMKWMKNRQTKGRFAKLRNVLFPSKWWDSNPRPFGPEPNALPNCATPRKRANRGTRTLDLRFTKPLLYRLSHVGTLTKSALSVYHEATKKSRANFVFSEILRHHESLRKIQTPDSAIEPDAVCIFFCHAVMRTGCDLPAARFAIRRA